MEKNNMYYKNSSDESIFLPGHPEADSKGYINIHNEKLLQEMARYILDAQKIFHTLELNSKRKIRTTIF